MRRRLFPLVLLLLLTVPVRAAELPEELLDVLPSEAVEAAETGGVERAAAKLWESAVTALRAAFSRSVRGSVRLVLVVLLTAAAEGAAAPLGTLAPRFARLTGVFAVTLLSAGDLSALIGLGQTTMQELGDLTKLLLPTMAAALAGCGGVLTASGWQVATLWAADVLMGLITGTLLPLVYCHIALAAAGAALPTSGLDRLADGIRKLISWALCGAVGLFTLYLSVSNVLTGSTDRATAKAAKAALSGAVPVVGGLLSDAAEAVLGAAQGLRAVIGAAGVFGILFLCLAPLARLGVQFLLYKAAAFVSTLGGVKPLERLLEQLGDAFALVFGMTAACALLLLAALLVAISMTVM